MSAAQVNRHQTLQPHLSTGAQTRNWPFAPLTEAQETARRQQECAMRREAARTQYHRLQRARANLAAAGACMAMAACGGGGDDPNATEAAGHVPTPTVNCPTASPGTCT